MILNDIEIRRLAVEEGMIEPFSEGLIRKVGNQKVISYGQSSYGYDLRLSEKDFRIFRHVPGSIINPKKFNEKNLEESEIYKDEDGKYFILPGHSYALGVAVERLKIPKDVTCVFIGKSTYARCGLHWNVTPGEAGWQGYLTLEVSNSSPADARIYANEGVIQALFLRGEPCAISYEDRNGKYQNQPQAVTLAKV
ncbi:deoxycytidine triphosphate deaminase [Leptolyngbyaceae cyanobacterium JSC-12]|nr:deoxycytidine triphosphate deaminase [Leptolyngbyaceae cyanobacterium JSC-12]